MSEKPVRIQRKRTKGFDLQAESTAANGLPCVYVGRPGKWGNPFTITEFGAGLALKNYRVRINGLIIIDARDLDELRGKNLACFCRLDAPCHADILLELANAEAGDGKN